MRRIVEIKTPQPESTQKTLEAILRKLGEMTNILKAIQDKNRAEDAIPSAMSEPCR